MKMRRLPQDQRGATLIVGLIMLAVITVLVTTAFILGDTNLKAVGNMQFRDEATAAANVAIEQVITGFINAAPTAQNIQVDLNNDGVVDYTVAIHPTCITSFAVPDGSGPGQCGDVENPLLCAGGGGVGGYLTTWDIDATVNDGASGASVRVHQGIRKLLPSLPPACA